MKKTQKVPQPDCIPFPDFLGTFPDYTRAMRGPLDVGNAVLDQVAYSPTIIILQLFGSKVALFRDFRGFLVVYCG